VDAALDFADALGDVLLDGLDADAAEGREGHVAFDEVADLGVGVDFDRVVEGDFERRLGDFLDGFEHLVDADLACFGVEFHPDGLQSRGLRLERLGEGVLDDRCNFLGWDLPFALDLAQSH